MVENIERTGDLFYIKFSGLITKKDIDYIEPMIAKTINKFKQINILAHLKEIKGYTASGFISNIFSFCKYKNIFKHIAIVGDSDNQRKISEKLIKTFVNDIKYFDISQLEEAKIWVNQF